MDHPTLWVSYCGKFRVIANATSTAFFVQSFKDKTWNTFSEHQDWASIKHKFSGTHTFSDIPDAPPSRHRSFTYFENGAFPKDGYNSLTFSVEHPE
jgi:hypothetical protein